MLEKAKIDKDMTIQMKILKQRLDLLRLYMLILIRITFHNYLLNILMKISKLF